MLTIIFSIVRLNIIVKIDIGVIGPWPKGSSCDLPKIGKPIISKNQKTEELKISIKPLIDAKAGKYMSSSSPSLLL